MFKILIVEDETDVASVLRKRLATAGFNIVVSSDAYQGVEMAHREKPDLIILDLLMPSGGGLSVLKNIRISSFTKDIPVVVLTGAEDESLKKNILDQGVSAFLRKPYIIEEVVSTINDILVK